MVTEKYIENLIDGLKNLRKYNYLLFEISGIIAKKIEQNSGRIIIISTGSTADFVETLVRSLKYYFKFNSNLIEIIRASVNTEVDDEKIENENIISVGVLSAIEKKLNKDDLVIALSVTGRTDFINGFIKESLNTNATTVYISSFSKGDEKQISKVDYLISLTMKEKAIYGLYIGNHTTLLKTAMEKILYGAFEHLGQIKNHIIHTTHTWTKKLRENSFQAIKFYDQNLHDDEILQLLKEANNELSTVLSSIILNVNLEEGKRRIENVNFNFNKLK